MSAYSCFHSVRNFHAALALLGMTLTPFAAGAVEVTGIAKLGFDFGGDTMATATYTSGYSVDIRANEGALLAAGVSIANDDRNFSLDATVGWKGASIDASNQSIEFTRYPVDVLAFYSVPMGSDKFRLRIGAGITYVMNPRFSASGSFVNFTDNFENALGFAGQIDAVIKLRNSSLNAGLRLTDVEYQSSHTNTPVDGSGGGLFVSWLF